MKLSLLRHQNNYLLVRVLTIASLVAAVITMSFLGAPARAAGNSYYVATNGSDSNPGTIDRLWATLPYATDQIKAGDTVYVRAGTYKPTKATVITTSGTADARITFRSYPGETAVIDASDPPSDTDGIATTASYVSSIGFEVKNAKRTGINDWDTFIWTRHGCGCSWQPQLPMTKSRPLLHKLWALTQRVHANRHLNQVVTEIVDTNGCCVVECGRGRLFKSESVRLPMSRQG